MKNILLLFLFFCSIISYSQDLQYHHDANGNRVLREVINVGSNKTSNSSTSGITGNSSVGYLLEYSVSVFPNPTAGLLKVQLEGLEQTGNLEVLDMQGKQVLAMPMNAQNTIDLSAMASGTYILRLRLEGVPKEWLIVKRDE